DHDHGPGALRDEAGEFGQHEGPDEDRVGLPGGRLDVDPGQGHSGLAPSTARAICSAISSGARSSVSTVTVASRWYSGTRSSSMERSLPRGLPGTTTRGRS